jgi:hypothetical protein
MEGNLDMIFAKSIKIIAHRNVALTNQIMMTGLSKRQLKLKN